MRPCFVRAPRHRRSRTLRACPLLLAFAGIAGSGAIADGQVVTPKTIPVLQDAQFSLQPSARAGMGGVYIALDDSLLDPFVNPAKSARAPAGFFATPFAHGITDNRGGGITLPVGGWWHAGRSSGTLLGAIQQIDRERTAWNTPNSERTATNRYLSASLARPVGRWTVGLGGFWSELGAVDGVDLLYTGSDRIRQEGSSTDLRLGVTREFAGQRQFEAMLLHSRFDMTHDVHYTTWRWDSVAKRQVSSERDEHNVDGSRMWGLHSEYSQPVGREGWRLGFLGTVNRLWHPKIPDFILGESRTVPRDPGDSWAGNLGVGVGRTIAGTTVGAELVYEPIRSTTWANAERDTTVVGGGTLRAGARTVDNQFTFRNTRIRLGVEKQVGRRVDSAGGEGFFAFQGGLAVRAIDYRLDQRNYVTRTQREQHEHWAEWTPTLGFRLHSRAMELAYTFRFTCGVGDCIGFGGDKIEIVAPSTPGDGGVIAAPTAALRWDSGRASVHQFMLAVPVR